MIHIEVLTICGLQLNDCFCWEVLLPWSHFGEAWSNGKPRKALSKHRNILSHNVALLPLLPGTVFFCVPLNGKHVVIPFHQEAILGYTVTYTNRGTRAYQHQSSGVLCRHATARWQDLSRGKPRHHTHTRLSKVWKCYVGVTFWLPYWHVMVAVVPFPRSR